MPQAPALSPEITPDKKTDRRHAVTLVIGIMFVLMLILSQRDEQKRARVATPSVRTELAALSSSSSSSEGDLRETASATTAPTKLPAQDDVPVPSTDALPTRRQGPTAPPPEEAGEEEPTQAPEEYPAAMRRRRVQRPVRIRKRVIQTEGDDNRIDSDATPNDGEVTPVDVPEQAPAEARTPGAPPFRSRAKPRPRQPGDGPQRQGPRPPPAPGRGRFVGG